MKIKNHLTPKARKDELVVRELPDELLVYDLKRHEAHCLNQTALVVWKQCDGKRSVREIALALRKELGATVDERLVVLALDQLAKFHLLDEAEEMRLPALVPDMAQMSRRQMMRKLGLAAAVALPLIVSISAPTAVQAASCIPSGQSGCTTNGDCCFPATCNSGTCT